LLVKYLYLYLHKLLIKTNTMNYETLKKELETIEKNHKEINQDPVWICVKPKTDWRTAKKMGCIKDGYYGWIFYSTSTNSNGYELYEKIEKACEGYNMRVSCRDL